MSKLLINIIEIYITIISRINQISVSQALGPKAEMLANKKQLLEDINSVYQAKKIITKVQIPH